MQAYNHYIRTLLRYPLTFPIRSMNWFIKWMRYFKIKLAKFDRYICHLSYNGVMNHAYLMREINQELVNVNLNIHVEMS